MQQRAKILKRVPVKPSHIVADQTRLAEIVADLRANSGTFAPRSNWVTLDHGASPDEDGRKWLDQSFSSQAIEAKMSTMEKMLEPWIGYAQMAAATGEGIERFRPWLQEYDPLGLWAENVNDSAVAQDLSVADLGSILDLNLIWSLIDSPDDPTTVLEVGGGYGRLAEAALNIFKDVKYVLVDAVPGSLLYSREYLRAACPDARIGFYYDGDPFDLEAFDCYIVPSWHFERINTVTYDVCVNIESFQEMSQEQVDIFLRLFDNVSRRNALMYISNHHDEVRKSETQILPRVNSWNYPQSWSRLLCSNTPRSVTFDHPTEVFIKRNEDWTRANKTLQAAHSWQTAQRRKVPSSIAPVRSTEYLSFWADLARLSRRFADGALRRISSSR